MLLVIAVIAIIVALDCTDVLALGEGRATNALTNVKVATVLNDAAGCLQSTGWVVGPALAFCQSGPCVAHLSWIYSNARGVVPWDVWVADKAHVWSTDWAIGLKGEPALFLDVYDSIHVTLVPAGAGIFTLNITGILSLNYPCPNVRSGFHAYVYDNAAGITLFDGWAMLQGDPKPPYYVLQTNVPGGGYSASHPGGAYDWTTVTFNYSINIAFAGNPNDLEVYLLKTDAINYSPSIPTLSEVGLIVLVVALVGTGVALLWWRKRKAFAAV